jgi:hypothetical protein
MLKMKPYFFTMRQHQFNSVYNYQRTINTDSQKEKIADIEVKVGG